MGRLIDADALIEELNRYEKELRNDREVAIETDDEQMLFAIMNQETAIYRIRRNAFNIPTAYDVEEIAKQVHNIILEEVNNVLKAIPEGAEYTEDAVVGAEPSVV